MRFSGYALALGALALAGCTYDDASDSAASVYYQCDRGPLLTVDYLEGDRVQVQVGDEEPLILPQVPAASGAKYMTARHTFWDRGDEATWTVGRMMPMTCTKVAPKRGM
ncbi:MliC family protein [Erythrobacter sp.]|uniref:MliC family protein n=1 Tax=Erythrobacter sp. TaxID=1042 RepID=UPI001425C578|nr:MliC family protein [Erythrobacter sp.]QIQ87072.1 MAG: lysozyme inhibitor [Erythrobacter sp.]